MDINLPSAKVNVITRFAKGKDKKNMIDNFKIAGGHKDTVESARNILKEGKVTEKINNLGYKCYDTEDFKVGYQSFLNKTKPKFKNK